MAEFQIEGFSVTSCICKTVASSVFHKFRSMCSLNSPLNEFLDVKGTEEGTRISSECMATDAIHKQIVLVSITSMLSSSVHGNRLLDLLQIL